MSEYAVIVQNDESPYDDVMGDIYNYPARYRSILTPGCRVIYYKGKLKKSAFKRVRLSDRAHYFGVAVIGDSVVDPESTKKRYYCEILDYQQFEEAVPIKEDGEYLEPIPPSKASNYWRAGVREIARSSYERILSRAHIKDCRLLLPNPEEEFESYQPLEGKKKARFSAYYERNPLYRSKAIEFHGLSCMACGLNFETRYGALGRGYIHVHHNKPVSESGPTRINPRTDMSVLCPNCHAMIHREKRRTLSVSELRDVVQKNRRELRRQSQLSGEHQTDDPAA